MAQTILKNPLSSTLRRVVLRKLLRGTAADRARHDLPVLACLPDDLVGREIVISGMFERDVLIAAFDFFLAEHKDRFARSICIDVGANIGNHACFFARYFQRVIAFEPSPRNRLLLACNVGLNAADVTICPVGLSDANAELPFWEHPTNLGGSRFYKVKPQDAGKTVKTLEVVRGDEYLPERLGNSAVAFIKVDVEGHELQAFRGLEATIRRHRPIMAFELFSERQESRELVKFLATIGYGDLVSINKDRAANVVATPLQATFTGEHPFVVARPH